MSLIKKYFSLAKKEKLACLHIGFLFLKVRLLVNLFPLNRYKHRFAKKPYNNNKEMKLFDFELRLIKRIGKFLPINNTCLIESLVMQEYFKHYKMDIQIYLGIDMSDHLTAHAWCIENPNRFDKYLIST